MPDQGVRAQANQGSALLLNQYMGSIINVNLGVQPNVGYTTQVNQIDSVQPNLGKVLSNIFWDPIKFRNRIKPINSLTKLGVGTLFLIIVILIMAEATSSSTTYNRLSRSR